MKLDVDLDHPLKGTVSPVYNYLKVIAFKSPWCRHMAPDIKSFFTFSLFCNRPAKFLCLDSKSILSDAAANSLLQLKIYCKISAKKDHF